MSRKLQTMDGNQAAAHVAYAYSEAAAIYPITPSSPMAELTDEWMGNGKENIFGQPLVVSQMQSEAGAAGAVHGALLAGALATTFTSSQGLLLMIPNLYRIAGELLPGVFHVAARTIATHALSIFGDHSDIYACRSTGCAIWAESSVQEVMDLTPIAHLSAISGRIPFLNFFDGFRTSHELHKIEVWDYEDLKEMLDFDAVKRFRENALHPHHGKIRGSAQNPDIFFQAREACNPYYNTLPLVVEANLAKINAKLGTSYKLFNYYGTPDATHVIIAMGSVCETIKEYIDSVPDKKYGLITVHLYRPFSVRHLIQTLPESVHQITVLDRTKEPGAIGEPLYLDVVAALSESSFHDVVIYSGRYGLSSKDTTPAQIAAVYQNRDNKHFTIGITDDVTNLSLPTPSLPDTTPHDTISCKFWGLGGDGTVSATKNAIKIIGNHTDMTAQGYFEYDSKKSRGLTISHLRFGKSPIHSTYLIHQADFVACHNPVYLHKYDMVQEVKDGGTFLLNCYYKEKDLEDYFPEKVKAYIAAHNIRLLLIDAIRIGKEIGLNNKISTILQAAFFSASHILPLEDAEKLMKEAAFKSYGKMGDEIIQMNYTAIERGLREIVEVEIPQHWRELSSIDTTDIIDDKTNTNNSLDNPILADRPEIMSYVKTIQQPVTDQRGNELPVSAFLPYADGYTPPGTSAHERRNVTTEIPVWIPENCIQCNLCSYVCPHAVIRPAVMTAEEFKASPAGMEALPIQGIDNHCFAVTVSHVDCTGCGSCVGVCPGKQGNKALEMCPIHAHKEKQQYFDYGKSLSIKEEVVTKFKENTVKGSQFRPPLMEFSGACAGCGETPYVKLLTQLFGPRMYIANATGCSSIWANSSPTTAYNVNQDGHGPAWSNSLFEDAAEFGFGMLMAKEVHKKYRGETLSPDTVQWVIGGDGWAYDIGFGGLDHVLASGRNINILVLDTEVYSNTGGQASKATPTGSTAKFITGGKETRKKDLASIAMTYGDVYVAQIAMGANYAQTVQALTEAAAYPGPSLVIAYATCIAHGIRAGLGCSQQEEKKAVETGYFQLFRYNPSLREQNKNPFILDSKEPKLDYDDFLEGEIRYNVLSRIRPEEAKDLFFKASTQAKERYRYLKKLSELYAPETTDTL
uniref:pyruvate:ferredoxin (flavodoxin) oxidoreductase n=1 Tax=Acetatifactor sp. TaxID=1872090 RepID=UPI0040567FA4